MNYLLRGIGVVTTVGIIVLWAFPFPFSEARGDDEHENEPLFQLTHKNWQQECGSCHLAYPPSLLPTASWRRVMNGLDQHFGENASLDPATRADILQFLETHAAGAAHSKMGARAMRGLDAKNAPLRITETRWFVREHDDVPRMVWMRKSVGSAANCAACHRQAEQYRFDEHDIRIPK